MENKKDILDKIKYSKQNSIKLYTKEQVQELSFYIKDICIGRIQKVVDLHRKGLTRDELYNNVVKENILLFKVQPYYYMDIETGWCYKSDETFKDIKGNEFKIVIMASFARAYRHSDMMRDLHDYNKMTVEDFKYIRDNATQSIIY